MRAGHGAKRWVGAGGLCVALVALLAAAPPAPASQDPFEAMDVQPAARNVSAPAFRLRTPEGTPLALGDFKGKVLAFYFWRTW